MSQFFEQVDDTLDFQTVGSPRPKRRNTTSESLIIPSTPTSQQSTSSILPCVTPVPNLPSTPVIEEEGTQYEEPVLLEENNTRRTYLITYSQADLELFPSRPSFGAACVAAFGGGNAVHYFCVGLEDHEDDGQHYHVAILLTKSQRWFHARKHLESLGAKVNFSVSGSMYASAYFYTTKMDKAYYHGHCAAAHPKRATIGKNLKAAKANETYRNNVTNNKRTAAKTTKPKKMTKLSVVDIITKEGLETDDELLLHASVMRKEDKEDAALLEYLIKLGEKGRGDLLKDARKLASAEQNVKLSKTKRVEVVQEVLRDGSCSCPQRGLWLTLAMEICELNNIPHQDLGFAIHDLLDVGRKKHKNLLLFGESNCAKTFLLDPLSLIFVNTFHTPPSSTFGWLDADRAQVIYLNDYRWKPLDQDGDITWDAFLRLLEGNFCKLPAPMNSRSDHIYLAKKNDVPIFCTTSAPIKFWKKDPYEPQTPQHATENKMMKERWHAPFNLTHQFEEDEKVECEPCAWCFCKFIT